MDVSTSLLKEAIEYTLSKNSDPSTGELFENWVRIIDRYNKSRRNMF